MELYEILELNPNASEIEIKRAYHKLAKKYHPDKNKSEDANNNFIKIQCAYEILINTKTRENYQKMDTLDKLSIIDIVKKILSNNINFDEINKYCKDLCESDFDYIKNGMLNIKELFDFIIKGIIPKNYTDSEVMSESNHINYYYNLPLIMQKINKYDIRIEFNIELADVINNNKKKIKIKRNINNNFINTTFIFDLNHPYIIFVDSGDVNDNDRGNLIIQLNIPNVLYWDENIILISYPITLYEFLYGININTNNIIINDWIPSRDGLIIEVPDSILAIKLYLNYENTLEKEKILKQYFS
jgi:curved DNA-binding protein CbpA